MFNTCNNGFNDFVKCWYCFEKLLCKTPYKMANDTLSQKQKYSSLINIKYSLIQIKTCATIKYHVLGVLQIILSQMSSVTRLTPRTMTGFLYYTSLILDNKVLLVVFTNFNKSLVLLNKCKNHQQIQDFEISKAVSALNHKFCALIANVAISTKDILLSSCWLSSLKL